MIEEPWSYTRWEQREVRNFLYWLSEHAPHFEGATYRDQGFIICVYSDDGERIDYSPTPLSLSDDALLALYAKRDRTKDPDWLK